MLCVIALVGLMLGQGTAAQTNAHRDLLQAAKLGQITRIRDLLARGIDVNAVDQRGFTPLMWASANGNVEVVNLLLQSGAIASKRAEDGTSAMFLAGSNGFTDIVRALLAVGANVAAARGGVTPRQAAVERGHTDVATLLEQAEALGARMLRATIEGHDTLVRQLLALGAPVNVTDERGATALMIAARNGDLGILQALLAKGADAYARDAQGRTVFDWAEPAPTGKYVVAFFLDRGVSRSSLGRATAPVQAPQVKSTLRTLGDVLSGLRPAAGPMRLAHRRATDALSKLVALSAAWPAESPTDYRENLAEAETTLEQTLRTGNVATVTAVLQSLADDLETKLEHCNQSGGKLGNSVVVRVRTLRGSQEVGNWQVYYMPRVFEAAVNVNPDLFPQLSSPTEETLVAGRYVMWVRDPSTARLGERTVVKVGEGKKELILDLPIPAGQPQ